MPGRRHLSFEFLDYVIRHPVNEVGDIVEIEKKELEHLTDNEDRILFGELSSTFACVICNVARIAASSSSGMTVIVMEVKCDVARCLLSPATCMICCHQGPSQMAL